MRNLFFITFTIFGSPTFAAGFICDGHELTVGDQGSSGQVVFSVDPMSASWADPALEPFLSADHVCGIAIAGTQCFTKDLNMTNAPKRQLSCYTAGSSARVASAIIVFSTVTGVGRITCSSAVATRAIEMRNCRAR